MYSADEYIGGQGRTDWHGLECPRQISGVRMEAAATVGLILQAAAFIATAVWVVARVKAVIESLQHTIDHLADKVETIDDKHDHLANRVSRIEGKMEP